MRMELNPWIGVLPKHIYDLSPLFALSEVKICPVRGGTVFTVAKVDLHSLKVPHRHSVRVQLGEDFIKMIAPSTSILAERCTYRCAALFIGAPPPFYSGHQRLG
jgi:hypothetical protein